MIAPQPKAVIADVGSDLPLSAASRIGIIDDAGERVAATDEVHARLGVDGLIRLHEDDFALLGRVGREFVHFNLERTTNRECLRYALVPILRAGSRSADGSEVLPVIDLRRFRIGTCTEVLQHVPLSSVTPGHLALSLPGIRGAEQLRAALVRRYGAMFPDLDDEGIAAHGCAVTRLVLDG